MPANLPKEARVKYQKVLEAKTKEEKLKALQEYLSAIPKHKGTENLVAQVRHQIAKLKKEIAEEKELKRRITKGSSYNIKKEGDLQYVLVGLTKSGKSSLFTTLTGAKSEIDNRPYVTTRPIVGTLNYGGVLIQLIDLPSIMEGNEDWNDLIFSLIRTSDGIVIVLDASSDFYEQFLKIKKILQENGIIIGERRFYVKITRSPFQKSHVIVNGEIIDGTESDVYRILNDYGMRNVLVEIFGKARIDEIETAIIENVVFKPAIIVINKADTIKEFKEYNFDNIPYLYCSTFSELNLNLIGEKIFSSSNMIRVYTKEPNEKEPSKKPLVVKKGATVLIVAEMIHKDLAKNFKYAKIWGKNVKIQGERVGPNYVLSDEDIIEIRA
jgi:ribosome-interacting GTPase 1